MAKGSGGTRGAKSGNSRNVSSKSKEELLDGWFSFMELYREDGGYSDADRRAFENMIANSTYSGPMYRGTSFQTKEQLDAYISRITKEGYLTSANDYMGPPDPQGLEIGALPTKKRNVVSFAFTQGAADSYMRKDYFDENGIAYYPVMIKKTNNRTVAALKDGADAEVIFHTKKNKLKVNKVYRVSDGDISTGFYTVVEVS